MSTRAFVHTTQREGMEIKGQRDRAAKKVKDYWTKVAIVTPESEDSGWTSESRNMVEEQREKLALSTRRSGELVKLMAEEKASEEKVRQELESLTFRDPDSQVGNLSNNYSTGGRG